MAKILVTVTQNDITRGVEGVGSECMVAKAVRRVIKRKHRQNVCVDRMSIDIGHYPFYTYIPTPTMVSKAIERYDSEGGKKKVKPFKFNLTVSKEDLRFFVGYPE